MEKRPIKKSILSPSHSEPVLDRSGSEAQMIINLKEIEDDEVDLYNFIYGDNIQRMEDLRQKAITFAKQAGQPARMSVSKLPSEVSFNPFKSGAEAQEGKSLILNDDYDSIGDKSEQ